MLRCGALALSCLSAGLLSALGFGTGYDLGIGSQLLWLVPIFALAIVLLVIWDKPAKIAAGLAFCFGLGHFGLGIGWVYRSLAIYGGLPVIGALLITAVLVVVLALFYAAAAWLGRRCYAGDEMVASMTRIGAAWVLMEFVRSWLFGGFGWLTAGYSQVPFSPLAGLVPFVGTLGATFGCLYVAGLIVFFVDHPSRHLRSVAVGTAAGITAVGYLLMLIDFTWPAAKPFKASVLQGSVPQERQWLQENVSKLPELYLELGQRAQGKLIVAPESALPFGWEKLPQAIRARFDKMLQDKDQTMILGTFSPSNEAGRSTNAAVIFDGNTEHSYAKRHLTPYGEYLPFASILEPILDRAQIPYANLAAGTSSGTHELSFVTLGLSICYESLFPELFAAPPQQLLVNITNDSWFDGTMMPYQHLQIASARALEHQRWLVRASNTGPSAIITPNGMIAASLAPLTKDVLSFEVVPLQGTTPYAILGNYPILLYSLFLLLRHTRLLRHWRRSKTVA